MGAGMILGSFSLGPADRALEVKADPVPASVPAPAEPTRCQLQGHAWERDQAIDGKEVTKTMSVTPRHFYCNRVGCGAKQLRTWKDVGGGWESVTTLAEKATP